MRDRREGTNMSMSTDGQARFGCIALQSCRIGLALLLGLLPRVSHADEVAVDRKVDHFLVSGSSLGEIEDQLDQKGPGNSWGRTEWYVSWSDTCEVGIEIKTTLPRLMFENRLPEADRVIVQQAFLALANHEENHARMGLLAAEDVKRHGCADASETVSYWMAKNDDYDRETQHGLSEGVDLAR
jgi:predicted secreted Zn-dependent protease